MRRLSLVVALVLAFPVLAQIPAPIPVYMGPVPNPGGVVAPIPKDFESSYADLKKAHAKTTSPVMSLVDDPGQAMAILTVTYRGDVEDGGAASTQVRPKANSVAVVGTPQVTPTLRARLTIPKTSEGIDFSGVSGDIGERTRWSTQATRIYQQAAEWLAANRDRLTEGRQR
jgi:hypothetical protein